MFLRFPKTNGKYIGVKADDICGYEPMDGELVIHLKNGIGWPVALNEAGLLQIFKQLRIPVETINVTPPQPEPEIEEKKPEEES